MEKGKVKFYNQQGGFGFIVSNNGGEDIFFHKTGLMYKIKVRENDKVKYDLVQGKNGMNAVNVQID